MIRPSKEQLAQMICEHNFTYVGKLFGVSGGAVAKWCKTYGIPHTREGIVEWYKTNVDNSFNLQPVHKHKKTKEEIVRAVKQIDMQTQETIRIFDNQSEAARFFNSTDGSHIGQVCNGKRKSAFGYYWKWHT